MFNLNKMQSVASERFQYWYKHPKSRERKWFEISGAAGTGKTTVVRHIIAELGISYDDVIFMAYVGKAALALRLSGVDGRTIHSVIYDTTKIPDRDENGNIIRSPSGEPKLKPIFSKKEKLPENIKLLVLDEGGMVNKEMGAQILSFGIPLLVLGDLNQLPPVFGKSLFLNEPDVILNEVMRQSKDSSILYLAQLAMHKIMIPYADYNDGECRVIRKHEMTEEHIRWADLIITSTNRMRDTINWFMRKNIYGIEDPFVVPGDRLICRSNCWDIFLPGNEFDIDISLVNGLIGNVSATDKNTATKDIGMYMDFKPEFSNASFLKIPVDPIYPLISVEERNKVNSKFTKTVSFELGYCSTCHLAQGSQYDNILIFLEGAPSTSEYFAKWLYTAITRAKKGVIIVM